MAGPGNTLGADHAFANSAELRHRRLGTPIAGIDAKLHSAKAARECSVNHELLDHSVKAGAALFRHHVGFPQLQGATTLLAREIGAHPHNHKSGESRVGEEWFQQWKIRRAPGPKKKKK